MTELNLYVAIVDSSEAFLVKDLSVRDAMKRIFTHTNVSESIRIITPAEAMRLTSFNILQIHNSEVTNLVL